MYVFTRAIFAERGDILFVRRITLSKEKGNSKISRSKQHRRIVEKMMMIPESEYTCVRARARACERVYVRCKGYGKTILARTVYGA